MRNINCLIIASIVLISACGPNQEEIKKKEKQQADSIQRAEESLKEKVELERVHMEKVDAGMAIKAQKLNELKSELEERLVIAKKELQRINEFQIGRLQSEKDQQIATEQQKISMIENQISTVKEEVIKTKIFEKFDFQDRPKAVIEQLILFAKNKDYSKLRYMMDPYGEYDEDIFWLCFSYLSEDGKKAFVDAFENARIMNEYEYGPTNAGIEVAIGSSSNRLETIKLIKRFDKWYLQSF
ncbi:MAG: hypothetical protein RIE58_01325 [Vicingaceae bacterium]